MIQEMNQKISEMAAVLAEKLEPQRIVLFGSRARGNAAAESDIDLLVIMKNGTHRRKAAVKAYQVLGVQGIGKDIVVVTEDDVERYGALQGSIIAPAISEGKVVYDRAA